jgi:hypothetical protein
MAIDHMTLAAGSGRRKKSLKIPKGNQKPHIEEQTIQWPIKKGTIRQTMIYKIPHR